MHALDLGDGAAVGAVYEEEVKQSALIHAKQKNRPRKRRGAWVPYIIEDPL
jgi:hypothetical protein